VPPKAEVHILDAGHFVLDTAADQIAALVQGFVGSSREEFAARRAEWSRFEKAGIPVVYWVRTVKT
jgi:hypothetical protein